MKKIKLVGSVLFGVVLFSIIIFLILGGIGFIENHQALINSINEVIIGLIVFLLILSVIPRFRNFTGLGIVYATYLWVFLLWLNCLAITYELWGLVGMFIGAVMAGVGIFVTAILALFFHGQVIPALILLGTLVVMYGIRMLGLWIASKQKSSQGTTRHKLNIPVGVDSKNNQVFINFLQYHLVLLTGETGSGKSIFHTNLYKQLISQNTPQEVGFIFLDMTRVDSWESSYTIAREFNPLKAIQILEMMATLPPKTPQHIFIHIEECDMFMIKPIERTVQAIRSIVEYRPDITIIFSTSRPSVLPTELVAMADTKIVFKQSDYDFMYVLGHTEVPILHDNERLLVQGPIGTVLKPFPEAEVRKLMEFNLK